MLIYSPQSGEARNTTSGGPKVTTFMATDAWQGAELVPFFRLEVS